MKNDLFNTESDIFTIMIYLLLKFELCGTTVIIGYDQSLSV